MRGKGIESDIGDHTHLRKFIFDGPRGALHESFRVVGLASVRRLSLSRHHREERQRRQPECHGLFGIAQQTIDREALDPRHGIDRLGHVAAFDHEHGLDQVIRGEAGLAHQPAAERVAAHAPQACAWESSTY